MNSDLVTCESDFGVCTEHSPEPFSVLVISHALVATPGVISCGNFVHLNYLAAWHFLGLIIPTVFGVWCLVFSTKIARPVCVFVSSCWRVNFRQLFVTIHPAFMFLGLAAVVFTLLRGGI